MDRAGRLRSVSRGGCTAAALSSADLGSRGVGQRMGVNSLHDVHQAAAGGDTAGRDYLQCADLDESAGASGGAIPDGRRGD